MTATGNLPIVHTLAQEGRLTLKGPLLASLRKSIDNNLVALQLECYGLSFLVRRLIAARGKCNVVHCRESEGVMQAAARWPVAWTGKCVTEGYRCITCATTENTCATTESTEANNADAEHAMPPHYLGMF